MKALLRSAKKIAAVFLIVSLNAGAFGAIGSTDAMFHDTESSPDNTLAAGAVDFSLQDITDWDPAGNAPGLFPGDTVSRDVRIENEGMSEFMYTVKFVETSGDSLLCDELILDATLEGVSQYAGPLSGFSSAEFTHATSTDDWSFEVSLPQGASYDLQDRFCEFSFLFEGGQEGMPFGQGFWDEEVLGNTLGSGIWSVVLNEFLPNPDGVEYGFDFGQDSDDIPQGEWVELYNNDAKSHNLSGWYIRDNSNASDHKILITGLNTSHATSTISGKDWLVVYINKALLNNTSDTVRLFNQHDRLVDSHSYVGNEFCDLEPTPGEENEEDSSGSCPGVPGNKSYARIPDGTGDWVDPIPTPGFPNRIEEAAAQSQEANNSPAPETNEPRTLNEQEQNQEQEISEGQSLITEEIIDEVESATSTSSYAADNSGDSDITEPLEESKTNTDSQEESIEEEAVLEEEPVIEEETTIEEDPSDPEPQPEGETQPEPEPEQAEEQEQEQQQEEQEESIPSSETEGEASEIA